MIAGQMLMTLVVGASWAQDYTEEFGDTTTTGCGSQWYDGKCEEDWSSVGASDSIAVSYEDLPTDDNGVLVIGGGSGTYNYITINVPFDQVNDLGGTYVATVEGLSGSGTIMGRVRFKNSSGTVLSTASVTASASLSGRHYLEITGDQVPTNTDTLDLQIGATGTSTLVWVTEIKWRKKPKGSCSYTPSSQSTCDTNASTQESNYTCSDGNSPVSVGCTGVPSVCHASGCRIYCWAVCPASPAYYADPDIDPGYW